MSHEVLNPDFSRLVKVYLTFLDADGPDPFPSNPLFSSDILKNDMNPFCNENSWYEQEEIRVFNIY